jgi:nucleoside-diphosphate-sugar epimerase
MGSNEKTLLLTGGGGLVGRRLTPLLLDRGWEIAHFDTRDPGVLSPPPSGETTPSASA